MLETSETGLLAGQLCTHALARSSGRWSHVEMRAAQQPQVCFTSRATLIKDTALSSKARQLTLSGPSWVTCLFQTGRGT